MSVRISVKVVPRAKQESWEVLPDGSCRARVAAIPEKGKANDAVRRIAARAYGVAPSLVRIVRGAGSARKVLEIGA